MVQSKIRIVNVLDKDSRGWLPVIDSDGYQFELFYSTEILPITNSYFFSIGEGFRRSKKAKIDYQTLPHRLFSEYFGLVKIQRKPCSIILDLHTGQIIFNNFGKVTYISAQANNLEPGNYIILNPDRRHTDRISREFISESSDGSRFAETWFPLLKKEFEFKYLHFGTYSNGCATVLSGSDWTDLYFHIITSRMNYMAHGTLIVVSSLNQKIKEMKTEHKILKNT